MPFKLYVAALLVLDPGMATMGCAQTAWAVVADNLDTAEVLQERGHIAVARLELALAGITRLVERGFPSS